MKAASSHGSLAAQLRSVTGFAMNEADASDAACNLAGFMTLLSQIDREIKDRGSREPKDEALGLTRQDQF
jgi:hypothetical protein